MKSYGLISKKKQKSQMAIFINLDLIFQNGAQSTKSTSRYYEVVCLIRLKRVYLIRRSDLYFQHSKNFPNSYFQLSAYYSRYVMKNALMFSISNRFIRKWYLPLHFVRQLLVLLKYILFYTLFFIRISYFWLRLSVLIYFQCDKAHLFLMCSYFSITKILT